MEYREFTNQEIAAAIVSITAILNTGVMKDPEFMELMREHADFHGEAEKTINLLVNLNRARCKISALEVALRGLLARAETELADPIDVPEIYSARVTLGMKPLGE